MKEKCYNYEITTFKPPTLPKGLVFLGKIIKPFLKSQKKTMWWGWRDGAEVTSTRCSCRGPRCGSQHPHQGSQPCTTHSSDLCRHHVLVWCVYEHAGKHLFDKCKSVCHQSHSTLVPGTFRPSSMHDSSLMFSGQEVVESCASLPSKEWLAGCWGDSLY